MFAHTRFRQLRIALRDRRRDVRMFLHDGFRLAVFQQVQPAEAVHIAALATHQAPQLFSARGNVQALVEGLVGLGERIQVPALHTGALLLHEALQFVHEGVVAALGQRARDFQLEGEAQEVGIAGRLEVDGAHARAVLRKDVDQLVFLELQQRVPDGRHGHAEVVGQFGPVQVHAGLELQPDDRRAQVIVDLLRRALRLIQREGAGEHGHIHGNPEAMVDNG